MIKNQLSVYHRAFKIFLQELQRAKADRKLQEAMLANQQEHKAYLAKLKKAGNDEKLIEAIKDSFEGAEYMDVKRYRCTVETDWVERIEEGLPYIEKAIMENRQFILQNGTTVQIDKAKRISKSSVEHLARHSEMITHEPENGGDLIPDKIFMVENTDNYAVYENRFLYMLLCRVLEFVDSRYTGILKAWNGFSSEIKMDRSVRFGKRNLKYSFYMKEDSEDDESTAYDFETKAVLDRIRRIQQSVTVMLNMPLMKEASRAPMLKPPITRTNVLKMDTNFRESVALFDYLVEYQRDGYTIEELHQTTEPFSLSALEDFSEVLALFSYLAYRHGGELYEEMERDYRSEEAVLKELHDKEMKEHLEELKKQFKANGSSVEKYIEGLEKRNVMLEKDRAELKGMESKLLGVEQQRDDQIKYNRALEITVSEHEQEIKRKEIAMQQREAQFNQEKQQLQVLHGMELDKKQEEIAELEEQKCLVQAQLHGLREQTGNVIKDEEHSSEEGFAELEREYAAFTRYMDGHWKKAKKNIRKSMWDKLKQKNDTGNGENATDEASGTEAKDSENNV